MPEPNAFFTHGAASKTTRRRHYRAAINTSIWMLEAGMKPEYCASVLDHSLQMFFQIYARWLHAEESAEQARIWAALD